VLHDMSNVGSNIGVQTLAEHWNQCLTDGCSCDQRWIECHVEMLDSVYSLQFGVKSEIEKNGRRGCSCCYCNCSIL